MDTNITINVYNHVGNIDLIFDNTKELIKGFENKLSKTIVNSDIYNINNNNDGDNIEISLDTALV